MRSDRWPLLFGAACLWHAALAQASDPLTDFGVMRPEAGSVAPAFTLSAPGGEHTNLTDYRGRVVLLNFWATWCAPCREEMPSMQKLWEAYRDRGLVVLAVAVGEDAKPVTRFAEKLGLDYPVLLDRKEDVRDSYGVVGLPVSYFIDREGNIAGRVVAGRDWTSPQAVAFVEHLLAR